MKELILENVKYIGWVLFFSGVVFEFSPIKINPISSLLGWIGKKLNKQVDEKLSKVEAKVDNVQLDLQNHKVESWRRDILDFADSLSLGKSKTREQFDYIISLHNNYEKYIRERGLINGQINAGYTYIMKAYNDCLEHNSFYTGK